MRLPRPHFVQARNDRNVKKIKLRDAILNYQITTKVAAEKPMQKGPRGPIRKRDMWLKNRGYGE